MTQQIYFTQLPEIIKNKILDSFGAESAAELGLDREPYATAYYDKEGNIEALEVCKPAIY